MLHEEVEKTMIDQLGLHYLHAHQIALRAEQAAVRAAGIEWTAYDEFMQRYVKRIGDERLTKVPKDFDLKPYRDEHDIECLQRISEALARGDAPPGVDPKRLHKRVQQVLADVKEHHKAHAASMGKLRAAKKRAGAPKRKSAR